jgi:hypothetical protein
MLPLLDFSKKTFINSFINKSLARVKFKISFDLIILVLLEHYGKPQYPSADRKPFPQLHFSPKPGYLKD